MPHVYRLSTRPPPPDIRVHYYVFELIFFLCFSLWTAIYYTHIYTIAWEIPHTTFPSNCDQITENHPRLQPSVHSPNSTGFIFFCAHFIRCEANNWMSETSFYSNAGGNLFFYAIQWSSKNPIFGIFHQTNTLLKASKQFCTDSRSHFKHRN